MPSTINVLVSSGKIGFGAATEKLTEKVPGIMPSLALPFVRVEVDSTDWSGLAEQLLVHIFEQQHNALDNCAAACTCTTWRTAVNSSHISSLHLRADQAPYGSHWKHFFASRRFFGHLRLTAGGKSVEGKVTNNFGEPSSRSNSLQGIPLACECLSVDTTFADMLPQYRQQPAKLKQLAVTWDCNWVSWTNFDKFAFPDLTHFAELQKTTDSG